MAPFPFTSIGPRAVNWKWSLRRSKTFEVTWVAPACPNDSHPAGHVDRVSPDVVAELAGADDCGRHRATVESDAKAEVPALASVDGGDGTVHVDRHSGDRLSVVWS